MIDPTGGAGTAGATNPTTVYDGGVARTVVNSALFLTINNTVANMVAATAGVSTKIIAVHISCHAFTTAGLMAVKDNGLAGGNIIAVGNPTALGTTYDIRAGGGLVVGKAGVGFTVDLYYSGNGAFSVQLTYYQAP